MPVPHTSETVRLAHRNSSKPWPSPRPLPPQPTSPHLLAALRIPEQLRFSNRQVAKAAVTVGATRVQVDLKRAAQSQAEQGPAVPPCR